MRLDKLILIILAVVLLSFAAAGCSSKQSSSSQSKGGQGAAPPAAPQTTEAAKKQDSTPKAGKHLYAVIETNRGKIVFEMFPDKAPKTVENFIKLADAGFYNGVKWHRVVPGFVIQGGDPNSKDNDPNNDGMGGPGYTIPAEFNDMHHEKGTVAMARSQDPDSAGSQFYICLTPQPQLDGQYTVFGQVTEGLDVIDAIQQYDVMNKVYIEEK